MNILATVLIATGILVLACGVIGILRLPDFYTRMHAAGKTDSLGAVLIVLGFALYNGQSLAPADLLVSVKILFIAVFIFVASPTATHAIMQTAIALGVKPWSRKEEKP
ncbi:MAG: monovalent cation/H(+) antiporter subunit G [Syntrophaceae bacterium]|nr:monovalent cation/H(+) antiporter subunit G [Syntrophaceae bacterium]